MTENRPPVPQASILEHARRLDEAHPDGPIPGNGLPLPDHATHGPDRLDHPQDSRRSGVPAADLLANYLAAPHGDVERIEAAFHAVHVPIRKDEHIRSVAWRADPGVVRSTGRLLVEHARDRCAVLIGLALLEARPHQEDAELVQTVGLLSETFAPLVADALVHRRKHGEYLGRLAGRSTGWGRIYYVEALTRRASHRDWLLRHSCDGDHLDGYYAGDVAVGASLHEAITHEQVDDALIDHTGVILHALAGARGQGIDLAGYPPAPHVLAAYARHLSGQEPTGRRAQAALVLSHDLWTRSASEVGCTHDQHVAVLDALDDVLGRPTWVDAAAEGIDWTTEWARWARGAYRLPPALRELLDNA